MGPLCTPTPLYDPATTVIGINGTPFSCPDVFALDQRIIELVQRIRLASPRFPALVHDLRADIDLLLERRRLLAFTDDVRSAA